MTSRTSIAIAAVVMAFPTGPTGSAQSGSPWDRLKFLVGHWEAVGPNELGSGEGSALITEELNGQVIIRRSFADYKSGPQAGTRHDDLLVIYRDPPDGPPRAIYFDSEGHVIRYAVSLPAEQTAVFESEPSQAGPRYRLSYKRSGDALNGTFEIAPPGQAYKTYLTWKSVGR